jgi:hypothetical protein
MILHIPDLTIEIHSWISLVVMTPASHSMWTPRGKSLVRALHSAVFFRFVRDRRWRPAKVVRPGFFWARSAFANNVL